MGVMWARKAGRDTHLSIFRNKQDLSKRAAEEIISLIRLGLAEEGRFTLMLSGGSTPKSVYAQMARAKLDWAKVHAFWGDERCVPPDHPDSNYRMGKESLLDRIHLPEENIHRIRGELPAAQAAQEYQEELVAFFGSQERPPYFDLILLGMGEDGHVASLFTASPALEESERWVIAVEHKQPPPPMVARVSISLPVINAAKRVILIVSGTAKALLVKQALNPEDEELRLPVQRIKPVDGELEWMLDEDAARLLADRKPNLT